MLLRAYRDKDYCLTVLVFTSIVFSPIKYALSSILSLFIQVPYHLDSIILWGILIVLFVFPFLIYFRLTKDIFIIFGVLFISWWIFLLTNPAYLNEWMISGYRIFVRAFPYYIFVRSVSNYYYLKQSMNKAGYIITICTMIVVIITISTDSMDKYDMSLAYYILPSTIIGFWILIQKVTIWNILNFVISAVMLIFMGARGPIVCFILYFSYKIFTDFFKKRLSKRSLTITFIIFFSALVTFVFILLNPILLAEIAQKLGLSIRVFQIISEGNFFEHSTRVEIYQSCMELISSFPMFGTGILSDRVGISSIISGGEITAFLGFYPHLIFLELIVQFGIVFGTTIDIFLLYGIIKIMSAKKSDFKQCAEIFLFIGVVPLLFSGSYLQEEMFYVYFGMLVSYLISRKEKIESRNNEKKI